MTRHSRTDPMELAPFAPRPIRFRVWDGNRMWTPGPHVPGTVAFGWTISGDGTLDGIDGGWTAESVAMLSTGMHDADGREVYEGDLLALVDAYPPVRSTVVYHEGTYFLAAPPGADGPLALAPLLGRLPFRVVGHVFDQEA